MNTYANTALIIVDVQQGFCTKNPINSSKRKNTNTIVSKITKAIEFGRRHNFTIIFTQMVYDRKTLPHIVKERVDSTFSTRNFLDKDTIETEFYRLQPEPNDIIFQKHTYDPFYNKEFGNLIESKKISQIVLCGFFLDVCIDSLARSAYQKNIRSTVLYDATDSQFYEKQITRDFMDYYYNTKFYYTEYFIKREKNHE